jgi:glycerophosphoryl diester phosphodiesterase
MTLPLSRRHVLGAAAAFTVAGAVAGKRAARRRAGAPGAPAGDGPSRLFGAAARHTLASYAKAIADGADFIEPDLVSTKDGVLIARHENAIHETTDVASRPEFAARRATKVVDGETITGWFTEDFTLAEIKTLRARRLSGMRVESHSYDGAFQILTFDEIADFTAAEAAARGRAIGLIPEIKHSTYFARIGLPLEPRFLEALKAHYLSTAPLIVQSFETANLRRLRKALADRPNVQLMQLIGAPDASPADFAAAGDKRLWRDLFTPPRWPTWPITPTGSPPHPHVDPHRPRWPPAAQRAGGSRPRRRNAGGHLDLPPRKRLPRRRFPRWRGAGRAQPAGQPGRNPPLSGAGAGRLLFRRSRIGPTGGGPAPDDHPLRPVHPCDRPRVRLA